MKWKSLCFFMLVTLALSGCTHLRGVDGALSQLKQNAAAGDITAQIALAMEYESGEVIPANDSLAVYWYKTAAKQGSAEGAFRAATILFENNAVYTQEVEQLYAQAANAEYVEAQLGYANFLVATTAAVDSASKGRAFKLYLAAAQQELPEAQFKVAELYATGNGTAVDLSAAHKWYRRSAELGNVQAQLVVGDFYLRGIGIPTSVANAATWYERAAVQDSMQAQANLGDILTLDAYSSLRNLKLGAEWYRKSAEQGHSHASTRLGQLYEAGDGVVRDAGVAAKWYYAAAQAGHASAECRLGSLYLRGFGVPQNNTEAERWFLRAAEQIPAEISPVLGFMYYDCEQFDRATYNSSVVVN